MPDHLCGPYACQIVGRNLKYWFALIPDHGDNRRYEVAFMPFVRDGRARIRPFWYDGAPRQSANFYDYLLPEDLTAYPMRQFKKGDKIADVARSMLANEYAADLIRLLTIGELPRNFKIPEKTNECTRSTTCL